MGNMPKKPFQYSKEKLDLYSMNKEEQMISFSH